MHTEYERSAAIQLIYGGRCDGCHFFRCRRTATRVTGPALEETLFVVFSIFDWCVIVVVIAVATVVDDVIVIICRDRRQWWLIAVVAGVANMNAWVIGEYEIVGIVAQTVRIIAIGGTVMQCRRRRWTSVRIACVRVAEIFVLIRHKIEIIETVQFVVGRRFLFYLHWMMTSGLKQWPCRAIEQMITLHWHNCFFFLPCPQSCVRFISVRTFNFIKRLLNSVTLFTRNAVDLKNENKWKLIMASHA